MMTPEQRSTLAAIEHYDRRTADLRGRTAPYAMPPDRSRVLALIERARSAELRDPEPDR